MKRQHDLLPAKESEFVEFKTSFSDEVIVSLVAFANCRGGTVYVGVDNNRKVKGITLGDETIQQWLNEIKNKNTAWSYSRNKNNAVGRRKYCVSVDQRIPR